MGRWYRVWYRNPVWTSGILGVPRIFSQSHSCMIKQWNLGRSTYLFWPTECGTQAILFESWCMFSETSGILGAFDLLLQFFGKWPRVQSRFVWLEPTTVNYTLRLVGGLEQFLFFHVLGICGNNNQNWRVNSEGLKPPTSRCIPPCTATTAEWRHSCCAALAHRRRRRLMMGESVHHVKKNVGKSIYTVLYRYIPISYE